MKKGGASGLKNIEAKTPGFVGFGAFSSGSQIDSPVVLPTKVGTDIVYNGDDVELGSAMRKVAKRDEITKIKGLNEVLALIATREKAALKEFLGPWCTAFANGLGLHNDRRVRAATYGVMEGLVMAGMRKSFSPYLPCILPVWLICLCDPAREVASLADTSLSALIGDGPQQRIASFASSGLLSPLIGQICTWLEQGDEEISDMRTNNPEEAAERCERVHSGCLLAIGALITTAAQAMSAEQPVIEVPLSPIIPLVASESPIQALRPVSSCKSLLGALEPVIQGKTLWKYCSDKAAHVRCACYQLAATCFSMVPHLFATQVSITGAPMLDHCILLVPRAFVFKTIVVAALSERSPAIQTHAWDAVLAAFRAFPTVFGYAPTDESAHVKSLLSASYRNCGGPFANLMTDDSGAAAESTVCIAFAPPVDIWATLWAPLLAALRHSGYGGWAGLYPSLLPLVACVPVRMLVAPEGSNDEDPSIVASGSVLNANTAKKGKKGKGKARGDANGDVHGVDDMISDAFAYVLMRSTWAGLRNQNVDETLPFAGQQELVTALAEISSAVVLSCTRQGAFAAVSGTGWARPSDLALAASGVMGALSCLAVSTPPELVRGCSHWPLTGKPEHVLCRAEAVLADMSRSWSSFTAISPTLARGVFRALVRAEDALRGRENNGPSADEGLAEALHAVLSVIQCALSTSEADAATLVSCLQDMMLIATERGSVLQDKSSAVRVVLLDEITTRCATACVAFIASQGRANQVPGLVSLLQLYVVAIREWRTNVDSRRLHVELRQALVLSVSHAPYDMGLIIAISAAIARENEGSSTMPKCIALSAMDAVRGLSYKESDPALFQSMAQLLLAVPQIEKCCKAEHSAGLVDLQNGVLPFVDAALFALTSDCPSKQVTEQAASDATSLLQAASGAGLLGIETCIEGLKSVREAVDAGSTCLANTRSRTCTLCLRGFQGYLELPSWTPTLLASLWRIGALEADAQNITSCRELEERLWQMIPDTWRNEAAFLCQKATLDARKFVDTCATSGETFGVIPCHAAALLHGLRRQIATLTPAPTVWSWQSSWRIADLDVPSLQASPQKYSAWCAVWVQLLRIDEGILASTELSTIISAAPIDQSGSQVSTFGSKLQVSACLAIALVRVLLSHLSVVSLGAGDDADAAVAVLLSVAGPDASIELLCAQSNSGMITLSVMDTESALSSCLSYLGSALQLTTDALLWLVFDWRSSNPPEVHVQQLAISACLFEAGLHPQLQSKLWAKVLLDDDTSEVQTLIIPAGCRTSLMCILDRAWARVVAEQSQAVHVWAALVIAIVPALKHSGISLTDVKAHTLNLVSRYSTRLRVNSSDVSDWRQLACACNAAFHVLADDASFPVLDTGSDLLSCARNAVEVWQSSLTGPVAQAAVKALSGIVPLMSLLERRDAMLAGAASFELECFRRVAWMAALSDIANSKSSKLHHTTASQLQCLQCLLLFDGMQARASKSAIAIQAKEVKDAEKSECMALAEAARKERVRFDRAVVADAGEDDDNDGIDADYVPALSRRVVRPVVPRQPLFAGFHPSAVPPPPPPALIAHLVCCVVGEALSLGNAASSQLIVYAGCRTALVAWSRVLCGGISREAAFSIGLACRTTLQKLVELLFSSSRRERCLCSHSSDAAFALLERMAPLYCSIGATGTSSFSLWVEYVSHFPSILQQAECLSKAHADAPEPLPMSDAGMDNVTPVEHPAEVAAQAPAALDSFLYASASWVSSLLRWPSADAPVVPSAQAPIIEESSADDVQAVARDSSAATVAPVVGADVPFPEAPPSTILPMVTDVSFYIPMLGAQLYKANTSCCPLYSEASDLADLLVVAICVPQGNGTEIQVSNSASTLPTQQEIDNAETESSLEIQHMRGLSFLPTDVQDILQPGATCTAPPILQLEAAIEMVCNIAGQSYSGADDASTFKSRFMDAEACLRAYMLAVRLVQTMGAANAACLSMYLCQAAPPRGQKPSPNLLVGGDLFRALEAVAHLLNSQNDSNSSQRPRNLPSAPLGKIVSSLSSFHRDVGTSLMAYGARLVVMSRALLLRCCDVLPTRVSDWCSRLSRPLADETAGYFEVHVSLAVFRHQAAQLRTALMASREAEGKSLELDGTVTGLPLPGDPLLLDLDAGMVSVPSLISSDSTIHQALDDGHGLPRAGCAGIGLYMPLKGVSLDGDSASGSAVAALRKAGDALTVRTDEGSRQIVAAFTKEEARLAVSITLPSMYPLKRALVLPESRTGITDAQWRRIELQLGKVVTSRDGSLADAVAFFTSAVEREFEGMEPCPICYCTVAPTNGLLPKMRCPTCKNGFHKECVLKWFVSSHDNKCPLCRQAFRQLPT